MRKARRDEHAFYRLAFHTRLVRRGGRGRAFYNNPFFGSSSGQ